MTRERLVLVPAGVAVLVGFCLGGCGTSPAPAAAGPAVRPAQVEERAGALRLSGTVEAIRATSVTVPRLAGQSTNTLVITRLIPAGSKVAPGDLLVEFDPQEQMRNAMDRRAEVVDLNGQIHKKQAEQAIAFAADDTALTQAEHDLERARLDLMKNDFIPGVEAEKNRLAFEQGTAKLAQLREAAALKRTAANADLRILEIRRERSERALHYAENNTRLMAVHAAFAGIVVVKSIFKGNSLAEVQEGDDVRPGLPILDIVDPTAMRVRARVNQADIGMIAPGRAATIRLDAYPELQFKGRVDVVAPLGVTSSMTSTVRTFTALVSIEGMHPRLMPDLTASVDLEEAPPR
jgi:multidrug efflux pump subunit AcrA (membrane-fusion protein)